jgi:hypothetical protein
MDTTLEKAMLVYHTSRGEVQLANRFWSIIRAKDNYNSHPTWENYSYYQDVLYEDRQRQNYG